MNPAERGRSPPFVSTEPTKNLSQKKEGLYPEVMDLKREFRKLLKKYGPQGWWPLTSVRGERLPPPRPMTESAAVEIAAGAILTQNTAWRNVEKALINLKQAKLLSIPDLLVVRQAELARVIRPSGFFNQKAKKLKAFAAFVAARGKGRLLSLRAAPTLPLRAELLNVHGIGQETADSILLYALGKPVFVIDAYTKRWLAEKGMILHDYEEYRLFFEKHLPRNVRLYQEFHALLVAGGKTNGKNNLRRRVVST